MQPLNPQQSLERLIRCRAQYERATGDDRTDAEHALQVAITRAEIEAGNLVHQVNDVESRRLYQTLLFETEMGKGVIAQRTPARR